VRFHFDATSIARLPGVEFFVPVADEEIEEIYAELATMAGGSAPVHSHERVYSVAWKVDATQTSVATVGERLSGDTATVLAIFPGRPYLVLTTARPFGHQPSTWSNPIPVEVPTTVEYFD
jgi:hypothetical protein